jgi:ABC-type transport system involved in multi-copper enzyme maturation permease subunit
MGGRLRAEWLRLRKRPPAVIILLGVPALVAAFFVGGYVSIYDPGPFDEAAVRAEAIEFGYLGGVPPEEFEQALDEYVASQRQGHASMVADQARIRATFAFPRSLITVLGNASIVFLALILLTAITLGDDFGSGTIRTALLANSNRRRLLAARLLALIAMAIFLFGMLLVLGAALPAILGVEGRQLPANLPPVDGGALAVLLGGELLAAITIIAFAMMATVFVRSGALSLVAVLVYTALEGVVLALLSRLPNFNYSDGKDAWLLTALPLRGLAEITNVAGRAASGLASYEGEVISRDLHATYLPIGSYVVVAVAFGLVAFWRFRRMDIVE